MSKPLPHSTRVPVPGFRAVRSADPDQVVETTLVLRRAGKISDEDVMKLAAEPVGERKYLTTEQLADAHGALPADVDKVVEFAHEHGLAVVGQNTAARTIKLSGTVTAMQKAFGVDLKVYENEAGTRSYRGRTGQIHLPEEIAGIVQSVHGLDNRDQAKPHFRVSEQQVQPRLGAIVHASKKLNSFTPKQVATAYGFPQNVTGKNQTIALIELGGGYKATDLKKYFQQLGVNPKVSAVSVDGATNHPTGNADGPDGEVVLDIEVSGGVASNANIVVYFAQNTDKGFLDAITAAIHDQKNKPSVVSISWGGPEANWTQQSMDSFNEAFKDAAMLGVTVLVASGDDGSTDGLTDGAQHVDFPASSPYALACGGTQLISDGHTISSEITWGGTPNDGASGGGVSQHFPVPSYQTGILPKGFNGRGVPDVAGDADPQTGYQVLVDGVSTVIGGTSAVAPLYAGLVALMNESIGNRCGFLNPVLYSNPTVCNDIVKGTNGAYHATAGWDATTGLGSIKGSDLLAKFTTKKGKAA
ncbi:MAG TPA: S53 family peptidase [Candidatus Angelobacter sp.]|nr:S53 family peptidase [Candidatus Angelobacter sp.]